MLGDGSIKRALTLVRFQYTLAVSAKNFIQIGLVVSEIWAGKFKRRGCVFKQVCLFSKIQYSLPNNFQQISTCLFEVGMYTFVVAEICFTVKPVWKDHPRCQEKVVSPDRWSFQTGSVCMESNARLIFSEI